MDDVRFVLSDEAWERIAKALYAVKHPAGVPPELSDRHFVEAVLFVARTGVPWRDLPKCFGDWNALYQRFRRWQKAGYWAAVFAIVPGDLSDVDRLLLDSTTVRAHPHAAGASRWFLEENDVMNEVFADYSNYYDLLYAEKDYRAEARYVADNLREHRPGLRMVVEFGSGTGRHGRLLARDGFHLVGIERSRTMLEQSTQVAAGEGPVGPGSFTAVEGDIRVQRVPGSFDAAIALFHVVSYQTDNDDVLALFRNAARHLTEGGLFLFDVWFGPAVLTLKPETRVKRIANDHVRVTRIAEPRLLADSNCVEVNFEVFIEDLPTGGIKRLQERHLMRYFTTPEITCLAELAGFRVVAAEEWLTRKPPSTNTWGVCYVLRRNAP